MTYSLYFLCICFLFIYMYSIHIMNISLIIILIIIIVFFVCTQRSNSESFDARIAGATKTQCGTACTKVLGCAGFAYDDANKYCYLSKDAIYFSPAKTAKADETKVFAQFYDRDMPRCNKLYMIDDPLYNSRNNLLRNFAYICKEKESDMESQKTYKIYNKKEIPIKDVTKINHLKMDPYTFEEIEWNKSTNLDKNLQLITNPTPSNSFNIMREYNNEYLGQYLYPHKCVSNITKKDCLKQCLNDKECVGTEWNPILMKKVGKPNKYIMEENICCPKRIIKATRPRIPEHEHGHFYLKENVIRDSFSRDNILTGYTEKQPEDTEVADDVLRRFKKFNWYNDTNSNFNISDNNFVGR
jgi:PAN domain